MNHRFLASNSYKDIAVCFNHQPAEPDINVQESVEIEEAFINGKKVPEDCFEHLEVLCWGYLDYLEDRQQPLEEDNNYVIQV